MMRLAEQTAVRNGVTKILQVHHTIVGDPVHVYGGAASTKIMRPESIPECDVLELDCEGSEISILTRLTFQPRVILVETHGVYGSPTRQVSALLESRGYTVEDLGVAEPRFLEFCVENDVRVLCAVGKA